MAAIRLEFAQFGHFDSFDVIRSMTSMVGIADADLPTPIATGVKTMYYVDVNVIEWLRYYYRVRVWRGSQSFVSNEINIEAILIDEVNNLSIKIREASIADVGFDRYVWEQPSGASYLAGGEVDLTASIAAISADKTFDFTAPWVFECEFKIPLTHTVGYFELLRNSSSWVSGGLQISYGNSPTGDSYNKIFIGIYGTSSMSTGTLSRNTYHTLRVQYLGGRRFKVFVNNIQIFDNTALVSHGVGVPRIGRGFYFKKWTLRKG